MAADSDTITITLDSETLAILERLALALEALVKQQNIEPPAQGARSTIGPFLGEV